MRAPSLLIVEDEYIVARDLANRLVEFGYAIQGPAAEGRAALALAEANPPDLVLMDIRLAGDLDGIDTAVELRRRQDIPVVFLTAFAEEATLQRAKQAEPHGYLVKPCEDRELRSVIEMALARHLTERRLRESERRLELALEGAGLGTWDWDIRTGKLLLNHRWTQMLGYAETEVEPHLRGWQQLVHPEDLPRVMKGVEEHLSGHTPGYETEHRLRHKSGAWLWVLAKGKVIERSPLGLPLRACGTHLDITERKRAGAALAESEARLQQALTASRMGVWELNTVTRRILWSPHGYRLSDPPEFDGDLPAAKKLLHPDDADSTLAGLEKSIQDKTPFATQARFVRPDGQVRWVALTARPVLDELGNPLKVVGTMQDITERKQLEEHLRQAQKLEAVGRLAGGLAHELNNVLAATVLNLSLLQMTVREGEGRATVSDLETLAGRAAGIVRQLLTFSRQSPMAVRSLQLSLAVGDWMPKLRQLIGDRHELSLVTPAALPLVQADGGMLEQLLVNLALNARDAMPGGGQIRLELDERQIDARQAELKQDARAGRFVCLAVSDTGCGMDSATLARLFEPFFTTKEVGQGMGMGLATVHGIVCQHQGWMEVESQVGRGSTFRVYLPAVTETAVLSRALPARAPIPGGGETILAVEDEAPLLKVTSAVLRRLGYQVLEAHNSDEAISLWQKQKSHISLLFADMALPGGMSGVELAQRLRLDRPELKVVLSGGHRSGLVGLGELANTTVYLAKPAGPELMAKTIRVALDRK